MDNSKQPAYPQSCTDTGHQGNALPGLTKIELFTMAAMQGLMANPNVVSTRTDGTIVLYSNIERSAITIALATLTELSKHQ